MARQKTTRARVQTKQTQENWEAANETRRSKFERIGRRRMNFVLHQIRLLGNLAGPQYEWHDADVEAMKAAISDATAATFSRFKKGRTTYKPDFGFITSMERAEGVTSH